LAKVLTKNYKSDRIGKFLVRGNLSYDDGKPVANKEVLVSEINENGAIIYNVGEKGVLLNMLGEGVTNDNGDFNIKVCKKCFSGDKLRYTIRVNLGNGNPPVQISNDKGSLIDVVVEKKSENRNINHNFGKIFVKE